MNIFSWLANLRRWRRAIEHWRKLRVEVVPEPMVLAALGAIGEQNPQWRALHEILRQQMEIERDSLLVPGLTDSAAQYNRGRLASLESFQATLLELWGKSRVG